MMRFVLVVLTVTLAIITFTVHYGNRHGGGEKSYCAPGKCLPPDAAPLVTPKPTYVPTPPWELPPEEYDRIVNKKFAAFREVKRDNKFWCYGASYDPEHNECFPADKYCDESYEDEKCYTQDFAFCYEDVDKYGKSLICSATKKACDSWRIEKLEYSDDSPYYGKPVSGCQKYKPEEYYDTYHSFI